ncbi:MAG: hypothetical protein ACRDQ1_14600 [Sciscionella sp.]
MTALIASALVQAETSRPAAPPSHTPWDTLYVAAGLLLFVLIVAFFASLLNSRERRGHYGD